MSLLEPELIPTPLVTEEMRANITITGLVNPKTRTRQIFLEFIKYFLRVLWLWATRRATSKTVARRTRQTLEKLGYLWIKTGQLLSLRSDYFSEDFCSELWDLQYRSEGFDPKVARQVIEEEIGSSIERYFERYDAEPFAAASTAQIHRGKLRLQQVEVVIKVLRPEAVEIFNRDIRFLQRIVNFMKRIKFMAFMRWDEALWEIQQIMMEETDYSFEAAHLRRLKKQLVPHGVYIPKVFEEYCTPRVLVMEYVDGALMSDYIDAQQHDPERLKNWVRENNIEPVKVGNRLFFSFMRQLIEENSFHGDLHPGNVILLRDSKFALIDLGTMGSMERNFLNKYLLITRSLATGEYTKTADMVLSLCPKFPPIDLADVRENIIRSLRSWELRTLVRQLPYHRKSLTAVLVDAVKIMTEKKIMVMWDVMKLERTWGTLDASLNYLIPEVNYPKLFRAYYRRRAKRALAQAPLLLLDTAGMIHDKIIELDLFMSPQIRWQSHQFDRTTGKLADFFAAIFGIVSNVLLVALAFLSLAFLDQQIGLERILTEWLHLRVNHYMSRVPELSLETWVFLLGVNLYLYLTFCSLRRRFGQVDERTPEQMTA